MNCKNIFAHAAHLGSEPSDGHSNSLRKDGFQSAPVSIHFPPRALSWDDVLQKKTPGKPCTSCSKDVEIWNKKEVNSVATNTSNVHAHKVTSLSSFFPLSQMDSLWQVSCDDDDFLSADYLEHTSQNLLKVGSYLMSEMQVQKIIVIVQNVRSDTLLKGVFEP